VAAVKRVVDRSLESFDRALVDETNAFGALTAAGAHTARMQRFLDAGGRRSATGRDIQAPRTCHSELADL